MIPLSVPSISGNEWKYVKECLDTGWVSMAGAYVDKFEKSVADFVSAGYGVAAVNGTTALHVALRIIGVKENDYVIVPNITFIASLNAIKYLNANPIMVDVDPKTWQMDLDLVEEFLLTKTETRDNSLFLKENNRPIRAIMPVHVLGNMCDMDKLMELSNRFKLEVVEDASESLGSYFNDNHSGTYGRIGVFSFNGNKIITTGGGGMIVTNDEDIAKKAKHLTTQAKTNPNEYLHDEIGYNYRLVNVLAAIGVAQMEQLNDFIERKKRIDEFYRENLKNISDITFQLIHPEVKSNNWLVTVKVTKKQELINFLNSNGVMARPFWVPMNQLPMFKDDIFITKSNHSGWVYDSCLSIPSSVGLTINQQEIVVDKIKLFFNNY